MPTKKEILDQLRKDVLLLQGFKPLSATTIDFGLGPVAKAFPGGILPTGTIHEFVSAGMENMTASGGFVAGLVSSLMAAGGTCIWISSCRKVFPPGMKAFGIEPDRVIFFDFKNDKEVLWAMEEALKCEGIAAVIGEMQEISFISARRLQLAVERSRVTGFILRHNPRNLNIVPCAARWRVMVAPSGLIPGMPGIGFPRWNVSLEWVKNGQPGTWYMGWAGG